MRNDMTTPKMPDCAICLRPCTPGNGRDIPSPEFLHVRHKWACPDCQRTMTRAVPPVLVSGFEQLEFELLEAYRA